jgi:hypothetical protein
LSDRAGRTRWPWRAVITRRAIFDDAKCARRRRQADGDNSNERAATRKTGAYLDGRFGARADIAAACVRQVREQRRELLNGEGRPFKPRNRGSC